MKKLLGIVVLGLLFYNSSFADTFRKLDVVYKDNDKIYVVIDFWRTKADRIGYDHCSSLGKRTFLTDEYAGRLAKHFEARGHKVKGFVSEYLCSKNVINVTNNKSLLPGFKVREISYGQTNNQTSNSPESTDINFNISEKKLQCEAIGFTPKTEKFADCVLKLVELDMKNQQSNNMITSQNKSQSNQFMSNALLNLGQQLLQPNSSINSPTIRNCTVRKFGNNSRVTCY